MNFLREIFEIKSTKLKKSLANLATEIGVPVDKRYHEMNRAEKREYKRYLAKNNMWDGDIVCENMDRDKNTSIRGNFSKGF